MRTLHIDRTIGEEATRMQSWFRRLQRQAQDSLMAEDLTPQLARIEIIGDKRVLVENHRGILEYSDTLMRINCGKMVIHIAGEGLVLKALSLSELAVSGRITGVKYIT